MGEKPGFVGVEVSEHGFAVALRDIAVPGVSKVLTHDFRLEQGKASGLAKALADFVDDNNLQGHRCNVVLPCGDYQLLLVEAPDVPDEELREAVRWKIKDLISVPVESAAIDVFRIPKDANRNGKSMVYVVATPMDKVLSIVEDIKQSGLVLNAIDIEELSLGNLIEQKSHERGVAVVHIREGAGMLAIYRGGNLYLSRQFRLEYNGGLLDEIPSDAFALEVQRSLDYFERQMGQSPPSIIYLCGQGLGEEKISTELKRSLSVPIEFYDFNAYDITNENVEEGMSQLAAAAIAVSYREGRI